MSFARPELLWVLVVAPLAVLAACLLWARRLRATARWAGRALWPRLLPGYRPRRIALRVFLLALAAGALAVALAGPRWGMVEEEIEHRGVDLVLVLDSSLSMSALDVSPNRLEAAKVLIHDLLRGLPGHRVALVQTEGEEQVLAPLTVDRGVVDLLLDSVEPASLPTPGTRLGRGLERALRLLPPEEAGRRLIVVLSDGEDHGGGHGEILRKVQEREVTVHAVGVGTPSGSPLPLPGEGAGSFKRDREGEVVVSRLEPGWLRKLARETGGVYLEASRPGISLDPLLEAIRGERNRVTGTETVRQRRERFQWFLAMSLACLFGLLTVRPFALSREVLR